MKKWDVSPLQRGSAALGEKEELTSVLLGQEVRKQGANPGPLRRGFPPLPASAFVHEPWGGV